MYLIPSKMSSELPIIIRREIGNYSAGDQEEFVREYQKASLSSGTAWLCWLFFVHYIYLRRFRTFIVFAAAWLLTFVLTVFYLLPGYFKATQNQRFENFADANLTVYGKLAVFFACIVFFWWVIDFFRVSAIVREHNYDVATNVFRRIKARAEEKHDLQKELPRGDLEPLEKGDINHT